MATIRKHRDKYQVQVRRQGFPAVSRSFHKLSDAKEWAREIERQADRQELEPRRGELARITLGELVTRYRDEIVPQKRGAEIETIILSAFLRHPICRKSLAEVSTSDFASYRDERLKTITPKSLKRQLSPVSNMFEHAKVEWQLPLKENPLAKLRLRVVDNKRERRLRDGELDLLMRALKAVRNKYVPLVVRFALETAMRRGEILSLRWRDIDEKRATATILETKNGHPRTIPLSEEALAILRTTRRLRVGDELEGDTSIFPIPANALRLSWERTTKRAGLEDLHFHDLRHEAVSRLFELGLTVPEVASISGHRDIRMLLRYAHANHASIRAKLLVAPKVGQVCGQKRWE